LPARAVIFDFNGTLSHDEPILCEIFSELFAEHGRPLSVQEYFDELAGLSDPEIPVLGTLRANRLAAADEIVPAIDVELMQRLLG
jgi:beta-phosphoglucomutase-like phosphatase (HAD superfamily)